MSETATYQVTFAPTGQTFPAPADSSLFHAMKRAGGPITHGCAGGGCGVCKVKILEGDVRKFKKMSRSKLSEEEEAKGYVLACCIKPEGDLVIDR